MTLFDTGVRNSYIIKSTIEQISNSSQDLLKRNLTAPFQVALGGKKRLLKESCFIYAKIEGLPVEFDAYIIDNLEKTKQANQ